MIIFLISIIIYWIRGIGWCIFSQGTCRVECIEWINQSNLGLHVPYDVYGVIVYKAQAQGGEGARTQN